MDALKKRIELVNAIGVLVVTAATGVHFIIDHSSAWWWFIAGMLLALCIPAGFVVWDRMRHYGPKAPEHVPPSVVALAVVPLLPVSYRTARIWDGRKADPPLQWPLKVYIAIHNDSAGAIEVGPGTWFAKDAQTQVYMGAKDGLGIKFQTRTHDDHDKQTSFREEPRLAIPGHSVFGVWVGLTSPHSGDKLERLIDERRLGTLRFPVNVAGSRLEAVIEL